MDAEIIARYDQRVPRYTSYPTAPHFSAAVGPDAYAAWLAAVPADQRLSLYLHVPFCKELCFYCGCHTTVARHYGPVAAYVDLLEKEIAMVAAALCGRRPVVHIHWGGGTPNILNAADILRIGKALAVHFDMAGEVEIAAEFDPRTLTRRQVDAFALTGLNRASLGVQDFDETVQKAIGREQSYDVTAQAAGWLRDAGVNGLNIDLMYGLPYQTEASVTRSVREALRLDPDRIALFGYAHVPWMKRHQRLLPEDELPDAAARVGQARAASAEIAAAGYVTIGLDHFAKPGDPLAVRQKAGTLHRNFQGYTTDAAATLIGFGTSAIGSLPQGYVQNASSTVAWRAALANGHLATARGVALSSEDRLRRAIIERLMCDLSVDVEGEARGFGLDAGHFAAELQRVEELATDGIVRRDGTRLTVPDDARLLVRSVCAVFDTYLAPGNSRHSRAL